MAQPPAGMPRPMPVSRPAVPKGVKVATGLHIASGLLWLFTTGLDMWVTWKGGYGFGSPLPPILDFWAYVGVVVLVWAGLDTRAGVIAVLVALTIVVAPGPLWALVRGYAFTPAGVTMLIALTGALVLGIVGMRMFYRPGTKAFLAESQAHRLARQAALLRR